MLKNLMLEAPQGQMDDVLRELIRDKWDDEPTAIQLLEALDNIAFCASASSFVQSTIRILLDQQLIVEAITMEELVKQASWRN